MDNSSFALSSARERERVKESARSVAGEYAPSVSITAASVAACVVLKVF